MTLGLDGDVDAGPDGSHVGGPDFGGERGRSPVGHVVVGLSDVSPERGRSPVGHVIVGLLVAFHVFVFASYYQWRLTTPTTVLGSDLRAFYTSWRIVIEGHGSRLYDIGVQIDAQSRVMGRTMTTESLLAYVNPPFVSLAFVWLGTLRVVVAYAVFSGLQLLCLFLACRKILRSQLTHWSPRAQWLFLGSGVLSSATLSAITLGTFTPTILLAMVALGIEFRSALLEGRAPSHWKVGGWICVLAIKPQLAVFVVVALLATRQWKSLRSATVLCAALVGASSAVCGIGIWARYFEILRTYGGANGKFGGDSRYMWNVRGLLSRVDGLSLQQADRISSAMYVVGIVGFGAWVARIWSRRSASSAAIDLERIVVLALTLTVLLTPHCNRQDTLLLVPAAVSLINVRRACARLAASELHARAGLAASELHVSTGLGASELHVSTGLGASEFRAARVDWFSGAACLLSAVALMWDNDPFGYALHPVTVLAAITTVAAWRVRVQHVQHVQHVRNEPGPVDAAGNLVAL